MRALDRSEGQVTEFKPTLADFLRLVQLEKEIGEEEPKEIKVTWVEPEADRFRGIAYDPLPSQKTFHRSRARFKGFSGPIGAERARRFARRRSG